MEFLKSEVQKFRISEVQVFREYPFVRKGHGEWHDVRSAVSNHGGRGVGCGHTSTPLSVTVRCHGERPPIRTDKQSKDPGHRPALSANYECCRR